MSRRRFEAWVLLGLLLGGCDRAAQAELEALRAELATTSMLLREHGQQIEALTAELATAKEERAACEAERARRAASGDERPAPPTVEPSGTGAPTPTLTPSCADGTCVLKRSELEAFLAAPEAMVRLARVIPAVEDGRPVGFKLFAIRSQSPLALLGLENGDLVRTVAGTEVHDMEAMLRAYSRLRTLDRWTITGTRREGPFEVTIVVQ